MKTNTVALTQLVSWVTNCADDMLRDDWYQGIAYGLFIAARQCLGLDEFKQALGVCLFLYAAQRFAHETARREAA